MSYYIYKIICKDILINDCYIGSCKNFRVRKSQHKCCIMNGKNLFVYNFIRNNGGWDNWDINILGSYEFISNDDKLMMEQETISKHNSSLNTNKAFSIVKGKEYQKEYRDTIESKDYQKEYHKVYRETNMDKYKDYQRDYRLKNKLKKDIILI